MKSGEAQTAPAALLPRTLDNNTYVGKVQNSNSSEVWSVYTTVCR